MLRPFTPDSTLPAQLPGWDEELGFQYREVDAFWMACWTAGGGWEAGRLYEHQGARFEVSPGANVFQYGQGIVEGLKARRSADGKVSLFRPVDHARRLRQSAAYLSMQAPAVGEIVDAVQATVQANRRWIPPYAKGSLYVRPAIIGTGTVLGVHPASEYLFHIFTSPVGSYLGGDRLLVLSGVHRAAPHGIGAAKAAGNYSASLRPQQLARERGCADVLYLDARESRYVEELSGATFMVILKDGTMVAPSLGSILPGITRDSVITLARELLGWTVVERRLSIDEVLHDAAEAFYTGTATILAPVTTVNVMGVDHSIGDGVPGPRAMKLRALLDQIQVREQPDLWDWLVDVPDSAGV
jgi:branched-chain amino acid aminotransferase